LAASGSLMAGDGNIFSRLF